MIARDQALKFLEERVENKNIIKHMLATEAVMTALAEKLGGDKVSWAMAGLLHDGDYSDQVVVEKQGVQVTDWLRELGHEIPDEVAQAMAAHNWHKTGVEPQTKMDWALFCGDSLTGLIVATALVRPDKKLASVLPESVLKKFGEKSFAAGTRRQDIALCEEKLGIKLEKFVKICLPAMQGISQELGL